jgi:DnaK suppressor protein
MITKKETNELREHYENEKFLILKSIQKSDIEVDVDGDLVDGIQGESIVRLHSQLSKRDVQKLSMISSSLDKIKSNQFGLCEECDEEIGYKRMKIIPGVRLCVSCAEKAEREKTRLFE